MSTKDNENVSYVNQAVEDLFNEVKECRVKETRKELKVQVKRLMDRRSMAVKVLANIDREILELKIQIAKELE